ncbi:hypothetical protein [Maritimibacter sp. 55A14]|uniref:hypothetical protein n=1 Tax=Maritimibacter sp. 55A14 TaxID=2174844 RepID=UPI0018EEC5C3|nr:hypothetical protein [Maritimibacter sp. 55A14]
MKRLALLAALAALMTVAGCADEKHYPLSGDECGPADPVQDVRPPDCPQGS